VNEDQFFLGVDVGSVSTNIVVVNKAGELRKKLYVRTEGRPVKVLTEAFKTIRQEMGDISVAGAGTTGSGRELAALMIGADTVKNEITAHGIAAKRVLPEVNTILEIGGQDSKIIILKDGIVYDFAMNTVCAAGTGSFLDRQASRLGIPISEFGEYALKSGNPVRIAGRCAVFAESDMIHKQQAGHDLCDIIRGLCEALAGNYLNNLAKGKKINGPVVFQGGVAANAGILRAFENALQTEIIVPEHYDVMGAYGAALLAMEQLSRSGGPTSFKGFDSACSEHNTKTIDCGGCSNQCEVVELSIGTRPVARWGDRCGKWAMR